jgi:hypothetical protein
VSPNKLAVPERRDASVRVRRARGNPYVGFRMNEWGMGAQSRRMQAVVRRVLGELSCEALICLKDERFEVLVFPESYGSGFIWPYFPIYGRRLVVRKAIALGLAPKAETRILLLFTAPDIETQSLRFLEGCLRDALGHVLLYLRSPKAWNGCSEAMKEWHRMTEARRLAELERPARRR